MIKLYSKPQCVQCVATQKELERKGVDYEYIDITEDNDAMAYIQSLGYMQVPVVVNGNFHWSGFRPDKIAGLPIS